MAHYDPLSDPDPREWFRDAERERVDAIIAYHTSRGIDVPNLELHARFHEVVETQLADGDETVNDTLDRLLAEGLDRHEALHAIGFVLAQHTYKTVRGARTASTEDAYRADLKRLSAVRWKKMR